jgi:hypothetical protein
MGSHSRDKKDNREVERRALFATDRSLKPVGTAYRSLLDALVDGDKFWGTRAGAAGSTATTSVPGSVLNRS